MQKREFDKTIADNMKSAVSDSFTDSIKMIDIDELHQSPDNFFEVEARTEELAETVYGQGGVMENLIVKPCGDGYEIISGHRRAAAVRHLLGTGKKVSRFLPCLVREYGDESDKMLDIVLMNVSARVISDSEMWRSYEIISDILKNKKAAGEKFGQIQKKLAEILSISTGQTAKMQNIDKRAVEEVKEAVQNGDLSINTAEKIAKLDKKTQKKLAKDKPLSEVKPKDIEKVTTNDNFDNADEREKVITDDNFNNEYEPEPEKVITNDKNAAVLYDFMVERKTLLYPIFDRLLSISESGDEKEVILEIRRLLG